MSFLKGYFENRLEKQKKPELPENKESISEDYENCFKEKLNPSESPEQDDLQRFEDCTYENQNIEYEAEPDYDGCSLEDKQSELELQNVEAEKEMLEQPEKVDEAEALNTMKESLDQRIQDLSVKIERNNQEISNLDREKESMKAEAVSCFQEVTKLGFGTPEYEEKLSSYNELRQNIKEAGEKQINLKVENMELRGQYGQLEEYRDYLKNVEIVNPADIEGYRADDEAFWTQHSYSESQYLDLASKIPEVNRQLEEGKLPIDLENDPDLGNTARLYFGKERIIRITDENGQLEFGSDGRHRIEAAKRTGNRIPVHITKIES